MKISANSNHKGVSPYTPFRLYLASALLLFLSSLPLFPQGTGPYILMEPIDKAVRTGDFDNFKQFCFERISVNLETPFDLNGYFNIDNFTRDFSHRFHQYRLETSEWTSKHLEGVYGVESLNVILKKRRSGEKIYYKFIFFMKKTSKQKWEIYYLKGLKI